MYAGARRVQLVDIVRPQPRGGGPLFAKIGDQSRQEPLTVARLESATPSLTDK